MSTISEDEVRTIANLARLSLDAKDAEAAQGYLKSIIDYVDQLNEVDVTDIDPYAPAPVRMSDLRDDEVSDDKAANMLLAGEQFDDGYLVTKRIVGSDE